MLFKRLYNNPFVIVGFALIIILLVMSTCNMCNRNHNTPVPQNKTVEDSLTEVIVLMHKERIKERDSVNNELRRKDSIIAVGYRQNRQSDARLKAKQQQVRPRVENYNEKELIHAIENF